MHDGRMRRPNNLPAYGLASMLISMGVLHFARPENFDELVPDALPGPPRMWTNLSGVAEVAIGVAVAVPHTRRRGALFAALFFAAVWPANFKMAKDWANRSLPARAAAYARLPLQLPLFWWAWKVFRSTITAPTAPAETR